MDEFLNELYGTSEIISGDDVEKQAAAEFLVKLAEQEGVNLDELSDEEVGSLLSEIEGEMGKQAAAEPEVDEAQEKLAEADFLGRAMAHAYVNELNEIEKEAGAKETAGRALQAVRGALRGAGQATGVSDIVSGVRGKALARKLKREGAKIMKDRPSSGKAQELFRASREVGGEAGKALKAGGGRMAKRVGAPALGGAALTAAAMRKKSFNENFEAAARERAYEMLADAGYDVEKVAQADIDTAALQMLEQAGYQVDWS